MKSKNLYFEGHNAALELMVRHKNPYALSLNYTYEEGDGPWIWLVVEDKVTSSHPTGWRRQT